MKKFEYKFADIKTPPGLDWGKRLREMERRWNPPGQEGRQFCMSGDGVAVFMREMEE